MQAPSSKHHINPRTVLFPLGLGTALSLMGDATIYTVLPTHTTEAGITVASVGILLGINRAVRLFTNGPTGLAYDRLPRRWLFIPALFLGALSTAIYAAADSFWPLFLGRLLWGIAWSGIWVGGATMIMDVAGPRERGRWTGLYQTWFFIGGTIGAFGGGVLTDLVGYAPAMWINAALTALGGIVALILLPETSRARSSNQPDANHIEQAPRTGAGFIGVDNLNPRANRELWLAASLQGVNRFIVSGVISGTLALLIETWTQSAGIALGVATLTGIVMAGRTVLSMASAPLAGVLSDRQESRWTVMAWTLALAAVGMGMLALQGSVWILVGLATVAISGGSLQSLATTLTGDAVEQTERGRAIGLLHTLGDLGSAIGPSIAYALLPLTGLPTMYLGCALLFLIGLGLVARHLYT